MLLHSDIFKATPSQETDDNTIELCQKKDVANKEANSKTPDTTTTNIVN